MQKQSLPPRRRGAGIQEPEALASSDSPWISASAGMTPSPATPQDHDLSPYPAQTRDSQRKTLDVSASTRSWSRRPLVWLAVVLLLGVSATVLYRASIRTPHSTLKKRFPCLISLRLLSCRSPT